MILTLKVRQGDIEILDRHVGRVVAEQFHHTREAHSRAEHFCGVGMPQLVRNDTDREVDREAHFVHGIAQLTDKSFLAARPRQ